MSSEPDAPIASPRSRWEEFLRINGGLLVALVIVGFFLAMMLVLPEAWPLFAILLGVGAVIAIRQEKREARGFPDKLVPTPTRTDADGRPLIFGPDMQIQNLPTITGHPVGIVMIIGLALILMRGIPESFHFLLGSIVVGVVIGAVLWWKHR